MKVIAGLGNPGKKYENTRHNMGFLVLDRLSEKCGIKINRIKHKALVGDGRIAGEKVMLVKPQTYMNLSGESIREVVNYYNVPVEDLIVIYDDMDLEPGALRIRKKGSAGSHNGMKNIVYLLQDDNFPRMRVGIGKNNGLDWKDFVMGSVGEADMKAINEAIDTAVDAIYCIIENDIDLAMNRYNTKKKKAEKKKEAEEETKEAENAEARND